VICCTGSNSCSGQVACSNAYCDPSCDTGMGACNGGVQCNATTCAPDASACP
jgi:hypothetical protein